MALDPDSQTPRAIELLAPAADLQGALTAFSAGADAVYLGLKNFSARKGASNFDLLDLRRLKGVAYESNKRILVALNTLIQESEFAQLAPILAELDLIGVDGVIVQDFGLLAFLRTHYPNLPVHASTQMAIHNVHGVRFAKQMGIRRVVLARELSLDEIRRIQVEAGADVELETFIHGALCFSFSGLCLASGLMLNRSGNRGECAQLCRSYYSPAERPKEKCYAFSCNDLGLHTDILQLRQLGVRALKIEGRMKERDYVWHVVRLYRAILDQDAAHPLPPTELQALIERAQLTFARRQTKAFFHHSLGQDLISTDFPGHRGLLLGPVVKKRARFITFESSTLISKNDSLLAIQPTQQTSLRFNAFNFKRLSPTRYEVETPDLDISIGAQIYLIHLASNELPDKVSEHRLVPFAQKIGLQMEIFEKSLLFSYQWRHQNFQRSFIVPLFEARGEKSCENFFSDLLKENHQGRFLFQLSSVINHSPYSKIFIAQSQLKQLKNQLYEEINQRFETSVVMPSNEEAECEPPDRLAGSGVSQLFCRIQESEDEFWAYRQKLNPLRRPQLPFAHRRDLMLALEGPSGRPVFAQWQEFTIIPLQPILLPEAQDYFTLVEQVVARIQQSGAKVIVGLNNVAHIEWARSWTQKMAPSDSLFFFADFYLYLANRRSAKFLFEQLPTLLFGFQWVEEPSSSAPIDLRLLRVRDRSALPYFISRVCLQRAHLGADRALEQCAHCDGATIPPQIFKNNQYQFLAIMDDHLTYLFCEKASGNKS